MTDRREGSDQDDPMSGFLEKIRAEHKRMAKTGEVTKEGVIHLLANLLSLRVQTQSNETGTAEIDDAKKLIKADINELFGNGEIDDFTMQSFLKELVK